MEALSGHEIRRRFLAFFAARGHRLLPGDSLVPAGDPTLLFTAAGMVQFKPYFLGHGADPSLTRAATCQRCFRTPDLERVGRTARHHTFFEMLGNFSFGDYFKRDALAWAFEFSTRELGLDPERLHASVFREDDETHELWTRAVGLPAQRVVRLGEGDNFWGPVSPEGGPCGPCTELYFDRGPRFEGPCSITPCQPGCDCDRYAEFWNLVFMQFDQAPDGARSPLARPCVDTGAGLERIACLVQGVPTNFETDLLRPVVEAALRASGRAGRDAAPAPGESDPGESRALRIVADHARAATFLLAEGVSPSNTGRGYVLRRVIRRALRHARRLGPARPFLPAVSASVVETMGAAYPELRERAATVAAALADEEQRFDSLLATGLPKVEAALAAAAARPDKTVPGGEAFALYDTHGIPLDLIEEMAAEAGTGVRVERAGFERALEGQKSRAREAWRGSGEKASPAGWTGRAADLGRTAFLGYGQLRAEATVVALARAGAPADELTDAQEGEVVLDRTPFYAEGGGQVGDRGVLEGHLGSFRVDDTPPSAGGLTVHRGACARGTIRIGDPVIAKVDPGRRASSGRNHTGTHLLHAALRAVLGERVHQAGSYVGPDRLRFDFSHARELSADELFQVEETANARVRENLPVSAVERSLAEARSLGALAFFGEKYGERVRVVEIGDFSRELCGGTHLPASGGIGLFKVVSEASIASGVRRIEAVTGDAALSVVRTQESLLERLRGMVKAPGHAEAVEKVEKLLSSNRRLERELAAARISGAGRPDDFLREAADVDGVTLVASALEGQDMASLRAHADRVRGKLAKNGVVVLASSAEGRVMLVTAVTADLAGRVDAGALARELSLAVDGSGGGRPELGQGGGKSPEKLAAALASLPALLRR